MKDKATGVLLKPGDVANMLRVSIQTVNRMRQCNGDFPLPMRVGRRSIRWRTEDITRFIEQRKGC